jgi:hypothetical protein
MLFAWCRWPLTPLARPHTLQGLLPSKPKLHFDDHDVAKVLAVEQEPKPYRGVELRADGGSSKWRAYIYIGRKKKSIGHYRTAEEAARAYDAALWELEKDVRGSPATIIAAQ